MNGTSGSGSPGTNGSSFQAGPPPGPGYQ
jgi:hypothetical protein